MFVRYEARVGNRTVGVLSGNRSVERTGGGFAGSMRFTFDTEEEAYEWLLAKLDSSWTLITKHGPVFENKKL